MVLQSSPRTCIDNCTIMAPRRGGGGGGGGRGGGGSSCDPMKSDFPCTTQLHYIYGSRVASQFTQSELYGQVVLYSIWCLALVVIYFFSVKPQHRWLPGLRLGILSYICAYIFLIVRYALIISESDVPFDYRYESSVVVMLERLGMVFLLGGAFPGPEARHVTKLVFWPFLAILAALNIAYFVLDFLISADAIAAMKDSITWSWHLSDRDFGLINTPHAINELIMNGRTRLSPYYVEERMYDISDERGWQTRRDAQIKTGVAADFLALILAVGLLVMAATPRILRRKTEGSSRKGTVSENFLDSEFR